MPIKITSKVRDGTKKVPKANKKPPLKYSNYFITIVSNVVDDKKGEALDKFKAVVDKIFEGDSIAEYIEGDAEKIVSIDADTSVELNLKRYPHCHALVKIKHRTNVRIPYDKLRKTVAEGMGIKPESVHMYCRLVKDANFTIASYINKHVKEEEPNEDK